MLLVQQDTLQWGSLKKFLGRADFMEKLRHFNPDTVTRDTFRKLRKLLQSKDFDEDFFK